MDRCGSGPTTGWRFPLPERHRFPIDKYALLRERVVADGTARADEVLEPEPAPWPRWRPCTTRGLLERIRDGALTVREQRGLGLPWSPELVERGRRAVGGTRRGGARTPLERGVGDEPRRRHAPRGARLRARLLPVQRRRGGARRAPRRRAGRSARSSSTATSTRATAPRSCWGRTRTPSRSRCTARATTRSSGSRPTSTSTCRRGTGDDALPGGAGRALDVALPRRGRPTSPSTSPAPTRGRATGSAGSR